MGGLLFRPTFFYIWVDKHCNTQHTRNTPNTHHTTRNTPNTRVPTTVPVLQPPALSAHEHQYAGRCFMSAAQRGTS